MKFNSILVILNLLFSAILGYWVYVVAEGSPNDVLFGVGACICFFAALLPLVGIKYDNPKVSLNVRACSFTFFFLLLICNFCFAGFDVKTSYYVIVNGLLIIFFLIVTYIIQSTKNF